MPIFKHPESYPKKWYFVACLKMYNSKEYEDMILRKGKYAQKYEEFFKDGIMSLTISNKRNSYKKCFLLTLILFSFANAIEPYTILKEVDNLPYSFDKRIRILKRIGMEYCIGEGEILRKKRV